MNLYDLLACPVCKADLRLSDSHLTCTQCDRKYPVVDGVPVMLPDLNEAELQHESELSLREGYNPWIEQMIMQSLTDGQVVVDAGSGNMRLDDPCVIRMDIKLTPYVDIVGDLHALPFKPASIDFIFALAVFEHLRQPFKAAKEIHAALKPGGYVYAECNFIFPYHGYPHHYFNASIHGLRQIFADYKALRVGVAPYQMPSFALDSVLKSYLALFKASSFTELAFVAALNGILQFPLQFYDRKFTEETAFRLAAGDYFVGVKQPAGNETIIPSVVMNVYARSTELQQRYPDPANLAVPDNLMTWAKTEGRKSYPEIEACLCSIKPFSKHENPTFPFERKILFRTDLQHPDQMRYIDDSSQRKNPFAKMIRILFGKLFGKLKAEGLAGFLRTGRRYFRK